MEAKKMVLELFHNAIEGFTEVGISIDECIRAIEHEMGDSYTAQAMRGIVVLADNGATYDELDTLCYNLSSNEKGKTYSFVNGKHITTKLIAQYYTLVNEGEIIADRLTKEYFANVFLNELHEENGYDLIMENDINEFIDVYIVDLDEMISELDY
jgi:hypothetical protein